VIKTANEHDREFSENYLLPATFGRMMLKTNFKYSLTALAVLVFTASTSMAQTTAKPSSARSKSSASIPTLEELGCGFNRERGANRGTSIVAKPLPHDSRLVVFPYDKNALFPVNTVFNRFTHFEFEQGERIVASYINDETEWEQKVSGTGSDILVRPRVRGAVGSMTTITDRRRYQIDLLDVSDCNTESRYQRVSWLVSDSGFYEDRDALSSSKTGRGMTGGVPIAKPGAVPLPGLEPAQVNPEADPMMVNLDGLNAEYVIEGDAEIAPIMVMDDGKRTWIKFRASMALRPALFAVSPDGQAETVEYVPRGSYFIVPKVFTHGLLFKLGKREVRVRNKASSCGWLDSTCRKLETTNLIGSN
jgi:type IV secretory pathway VirB9-like protein